MKEANRTVDQELGSDGSHCTVTGFVQGADHAGGGARRLATTLVIGLQWGVA